MKISIKFLKEAKEALDFGNEVKDEEVLSEILSILREKPVNY